MTHGRTAADRWPRRLIALTTVAAALWGAAAGTATAAPFGGPPYDLGPRQEREYLVELRLAGVEAHARMAEKVIAAAKSQIGVPYHYLMARPGVGFDCSGLAMWAWGRVGVSLPHNSADQYAVLPHVSRADLEPGDLLFFYSPIHHVAIYLGHGLMIHAPHTGEHVMIQRIYWQYFDGAARPRGPRVTEP